MPAHPARRTQRERREQTERKVLAAATALADTVRAYLKNVTSRRPAARAFMQMWSEAIAADSVLMPLYAQQDASFRRLLADKVREGVRDGIDARQGLSARRVVRSASSMIALTRAA